MIVSICCLEIPMPGFDGKNQVWRIVWLSLRITGCKFILFVENIQILRVFCLKKYASKLHFVGRCVELQHKRRTDGCSRCCALAFCYRQKMGKMEWSAAPGLLFGGSHPYCLGCGRALTVWGQSSRTFRAGGCRCRWCGSGQSTRLAGRAWRCCRRRRPRSGTG